MDTVMDFFFGGLEVMPEFVVMVRVVLVFFVYNFALKLMETFNGRGGRR